MTFKEFIKNLTPYTFVYIRFEGDTFIYDKNYKVEKFGFQTMKAATAAMNEMCQNLIEKFCTYKPSIICIEL